MRVTRTTWIVAAVLLVLLSGISNVTSAQELFSISPSQSTASPGRSPSGTTHATPGASLDPATFIRVYEDTKVGNRFSLYEPVQTVSKKGLQLAAGLESSIVIERDAEKM